MIESSRIKILNDKPITDGKYVLYWMQASQRTEYNHALEYAILKANELNLPLVVYFGLAPNYPNANLRHYSFMLAGLREVKSQLLSENIKFLMLKCQPNLGAIELAKDCAILITDRGYLRFQREIRTDVSMNISCQMLQIETDVIVPIELVSDKEEYAAATIRKKIFIHLDSFRFEVPHNTIKICSIGFNVEISDKFLEIDLEDIPNLLNSLPIDKNVKDYGFYKGGTSSAKAILEDFIDNKLQHFNDKRNDPSEEYLSNMSPYLHFGNISPLYILLKIDKVQGFNEAKSSFIEELVIRRELSMNYAYYNQCYDCYEGIPNWAKLSLELHKEDTRPITYSLEELESFHTHDPYWNAAQKELVIKGKMHGYMRMYWGKKIIEWTKDIEEAYNILIYLNDKYSLDGRDPNGYTGIAWCFGKHDRPWKEREVFGKIRYMNAGGLKRKFDIDRYVSNIDNLEY
ncbi:deoxyribodipyrimidine photo-lyase [Clostridium sp. C8-1-8]|uniref:deoxyribodipyrimidine photo-lyase n=1 Tax=Clostridium sp. C8-1-8 TaxID=2698831 RepID=UPI0013718F87|nr:deoxyribodipyrimidine photo-lyase [Clostridium sp. C8-1-8]